MIKIRERAEVDGAFKNALVEMAGRKVEELDRRLAHANPNQKKAQRVLIGNAEGLHSGRLLDQEVTRLRALPYARFTARRFKGQLYLVGVTRDVVLECMRGSNRHKLGDRWDVGSYMITISVDDFLNNSAARVHAIPRRDPQSFQRTPHHHASSRSLSDLTDISLTPATCWGSMGGLVLSTLKNFMPAEFFRSMHIYVSRFDAGSPLGGVEPMAFARKLS